MGGSQSTRRVIVEDANGEDVVKISDAVVRRIHGLPAAPEVSSDQTSSTKSVPFQPREDTAAQAREEERYQRMNKEVEDFYTAKLNDLHRRSHALQQETNEQFASAVEEIEQKFLNYTSSPICQDLQLKVLQCYQANPSETLNCSAIVNAFTSCVERARISSSINRPKTNPQVEPVS